MSEESEPVPRTRSTTRRVIALLTLVSVVGGVATAIISAAGWVTPVTTILLVVISVAPVAIFSLISARRHLDVLRWWEWLGGLVLLVAIVVVAVLSRDDDRQRFSGDLEENESFSVDIDGSGKRVVASLRASGGLEAVLSARRTGQRHDGAPVDNGLIVLDETLAGSSWQLQVEAINGTSGRYELEIEAVESPQQIEVEQTIEDDLADESDSDSFVLELRESGPVFVRMTPVTVGVAMDLNVLTTRNVKAGYHEAEGRSWVLFSNLPGGTYVIVIDGEAGGRYRLELATTRPDQPGMLPDTPEGDAQLPLVVRTAREDAELALRDAGFAPTFYDVCSGSVDPGIVRQVVQLQSDREIVLEDLDGRVGASRVDVNAELVVKVGTGQPCNN